MAKTHYTVTTHGIDHAACTSAKVSLSWGDAFFTESAQHVTCTKCAAYCEKISKAMAQNIIDNHASKQITIEVEHGSNDAHVAAYQCANTSTLIDESGIDDYHTHGLEMICKGSVVQRATKVPGCTGTVSVFTCAICGEQGTRPHNHPRYPFSAWSAPRFTDLLNPTPESGQPGNVDPSGSCEPIGCTLVDCDSQDTASVAALEPVLSLSEAEALSVVILEQLICMSDAPALSELLTIKSDVRVIPDHTTDDGSPMGYDVQLVIGHDTHVVASLAEWSAVLEGYLFANV